MRTVTIVAVFVITLWANLSFADDHHSSSPRRFIVEGVIEGEVISGGGETKGGPGAGFDLVFKVVPKRFDIHLGLSALLHLPFKFEGKEPPVTFFGNLTLSTEFYVGKTIWLGPAGFVGCGIGATKECEAGGGLLMRTEVRDLDSRGTVGIVGGLVTDIGGSHEGSGEVKSPSEGGAPFKGILSLQITFH